MYQFYSKRKRYVFNFILFKERKYFWIYIKFTVNFQKGRSFKRAEAKKSEEKAEAEKSGDVKEEDTSKSDAKKSQKSSRSKRSSLLRPSVAAGVSKSRRGSSLTSSSGSKLKSTVKETTKPPGSSSSRPSTSESKPRASTHNRSRPSVSLLDVIERDKRKHDLNRSSAWRAQTIHHVATHLEWARNGYETICTQILQARRVDWH